MSCSGEGNVGLTSGQPSLPKRNWLLALLTKRSGAFSKTDSPCVLVSCKCDNPPRARQIEAGTVEELGQNFGGIDTYQTSANVPESQKRCISILLRAILAKSSGELDVLYCSPGPLSYNLVVVCKSSKFFQYNFAPLRYQLGGSKFFSILWRSHKLAFLSFS